MGENEYTETVTRSYGENVKNSIGGIVFGLLLFVLSIVLLWNNEGNLANKNEIAKFINKEAIPVESVKVDTANNNKLISTTGEATTEAKLTDGIITVPQALVLNRNVEMYQWQENQETKSETKMGGSTTETTTYTYEKVWSDHQIDSSKFHKTSYYNPPFTLKSERFEAKTGKFGDFKLCPIQTSSFHNLSDYTELPENSRYKICDNYYYKGNNIEQPSIGDIRISYSYVPSGTQISVVGVQRADKTITPMISKNGKIYIQYEGLLSQNEVIEKYRQGNAFTTNLFRLIGFLMMFFGLNMMLKPLSMVLSFIPLFANLVSAITGGIVFLISAILSLTVIAISWLCFRPVLAIVLFIIIAGLIYLIKTQLPKKQ